MSKFDGFVVLLAEHGSWTVSMYVQYETTIIYP